VTGRESGLENIKRIENRSGFCFWGGKAGAAIVRRVRKNEVHVTPLGSEPNLSRL